MTGRPLASAMPLHLFVSPGAGRTGDSDAPPNYGPATLVNERTDRPAIVWFHFWFVRQLASGEVDSKSRSQPVGSIRLYAKLSLTHFALGYWVGASNGLGESHFSVLEPGHPLVHTMALLWPWPEQMREGNIK